MEKYFTAFAQVLVQIGANLQAGDTAIIKCQPFRYALAQSIAQECYKSGAKFVKIEYEDSRLEYIKAESCQPQYLNYYPQWLYDYMRGYGVDDICIIELHEVEINQKDLVCPQHLETIRCATEKCSAGLVDAMAFGKTSYVKTVVPSHQWAEYVYPSMDKAMAYEKLWDTFAQICRLTDADPVASWQEHKARIKANKLKLDAMQLQKLIFKSNKTNLEVGLVKGGKWIGGCAVNQKTNLEYVPNIPTEEIFFVPDKYEINGTVVSTLPLNYKGRLICDIELTIHDGVITSYSASQGMDLLDAIINADDGAKRFGEVSLVSVASPIYMSNTIFYTTLLDENSTCHMAIGKGTPGVVQNGYDLNAHERDLLGINDSCVHVDFMIGSPTLDVFGVNSQGETIRLMSNGDWRI